MQQKKKEVTIAIEMIVISNRIGRRNKMFLMPLSNKIKLLKDEPLPLFYWSERKFIFKDKENYGDLLSEYLVEKISGTPVRWVHPKKQPWYKWNKMNYLAIGSIIHHATKDSVIWGSGIIDQKQKTADADFRAVRGPRTRNYLLNLGYKCPPVYGDPALLLPLYFKPEEEKKYKLGIIPHYHDYKNVAKTYQDQTEILVIDLMTLNVEEVTHEILQCEKTISSSLHGLIVSHAYRTPCVWVEFSDKLFGDGIKFTDYMESVELQVYQPQFLRERLSLEELEELLNKFPAQPEWEVLERLQKDLLIACPFRSE
ncbi:polysaccharide pyruvyl transferase family protein [Antarcticibacterium sp. 1MA-6-2]|uniref:polysaccharide pyruvyl transferase family protein n=1 Tax=Antarcticibacterium sp. 1MA-6-2 TaxID=2908210 RepID=UPI001F40042E|nr:polysaccharide pyruvyl transferase family protein [Antarcticibacterium sp. 1MA-6-2]UJH92532.1 polysaccharide pyruvyl transferase family protein [Antarcticibacterium sp. 1MA-6-2]